MGSSDEAYPFLFGASLCLLLSTSPHDNLFSLLPKISVKYGEKLSGRNNWSNFYPQFHMLGVGSQNLKFPVEDTPYIRAQYPD